MSIRRLFFQTDNKGWAKREGETGEGIWAEVAVRRDIDTTPSLEGWRLVPFLHASSLPFPPERTPPTIAVLVSHTADIPPLYTFKAGGAQQWAGRIFTITDYRIRTGWREWKESRSYRSESHSSQTPYFHWTGLFSNGGIDTAIHALSNWILSHWFCNWQKI